MTGPACPPAGFYRGSKYNTPMSKENNKLQVIDVIESSGLEPETTTDLKKRFLPFWEQANEWAERAKTLVVTDESQTAEIKMARVARLALRDIRVAADKERKELKAESIRKGKAIQGIYNIIEYLIKPTEEYLYTQEKFVEIRQEAARQELNREREAKAAPWSQYIDYTALPETNAPWADLTAEQFQAFLDRAGKLKLAHEKAEAERLAAEQARLEEEARIRAENERLKKEAEERELQASEERRAMEEQARKEREQAQAKLDAERAARARLEAENRKREEAERKAREAEEAARRKAEQAPDKEKLLAFAADLSSLDFPAVTSMNAREIVKEYSDRISALASSLRAEAEQL